MIRLALTEFRQNPKLLECDQISLLAAVIKCAQLGLEPGNGLGHVYLVPFFNTKAGRHEVNVIPGYRGLIELARRGGEVVSIVARIVYEADHFHLQYGDDEKIVHSPYLGAEDPGKPVAVYAIARLKDGSNQREVMTMGQVDAVRRRGNRNPVWDSDFDEMARKTVVRRIMKYLPLSSELSEVIAHDNEAQQAFPEVPVHALSPADIQVAAVEFKAFVDTLGKARVESILDMPLEKAESQISEEMLSRLHAAAIHTVGKA